MKQVININFHGTIVPIETTAYDMLKGYIESLNKHFANEEGKEEIINDIESRIAELFQERLKKGATCITDDDLNAIIDSMGRVEDFEKEEGTAAPNDDTSKKQQGSSAAFAQAAGPKKLFRDENNKVLGGVCAGLANYFNIDIAIVRIIFVILLFSGIGFLTYIIMWIAVPSSASLQIGGPRKKLYRDTDDKWIAGVCSGIGNYFGISPWIPRILFLLPFLSFISRWGHWGGLWNFGDVVRFTFSPTSLIIYIILWIVIPEAFTTTEKLEMKGEKVDVDSIKNSVMEEMKTAGKKAQSFGKELAGTVNEKASAVAGDVQQLAKKHKGGVGDVIAMIAKIFAYFIVGIVGITLIGLLIALIGLSAKIFPLKDFLLDGGWQTAFAWGTLFFFIAVPVIAILTWIVRKIAKSKSNSRMLRLTFISLWIVGWACFMLLLSSVNRDFKSYSKLPEEQVTLSNAKVNKLVISTTAPGEKISKRYRWSRFDSFEEFLQEDTISIQNIKLEFEKSPNDSFQVSVLKQARGNTREFANRLADKIAFNIKQADSMLVLDKGIEVNKTDKFRNQSVIVVVYVPVGKQVRVNSNFYKRLYFNGFTNIDDYERGENYYSDSRWQAGVDYIMNADGSLYTLSGKKATGWNDDSDDDTEVRIGKDGIKVREGGKKTQIGPDGIIITDDNEESNYRYDRNESKPGNNKYDSLKMELEKKKQREIDSLKNKLKQLEGKAEINNDNVNEIATVPGLVLFPQIY